MQTGTGTLSLIAGACILAWWLRRKATDARLPPSPPGLPILGNALQIPEKLLFIPVQKWKEAYPEIFTLDALGQKFIFLNTPKVAADILDRMTSVTSGRPEFVMARDIMTHDNWIAMMPANEKWRSARRVIHEGFNIRAVTAFFPFQEYEAANLIRRLLKDQSNMAKQTQLVSSISTWRAFYSGPTFDLADEDNIAKVDDAVITYLASCVPMKWLVDVIPALRYLPSWAAGFKVIGDKFFAENNKLFVDLYREARQQKAGVQYHQGWVASSAESVKKFGLSEEYFAWTVSGMFGAGGETTAVTLHYFVQAMVLNPEVARKAQEQLDSVVGWRLPTFADRDNLPYIDAIVKEVLRWRPAAPLGVPHVATEEFPYNGYTIPKGATLIPNIWGITHDPDVFPEPDSFIPERFLTSDGKLKESSADFHDDIVAFGYGRRVCPGKNFAYNMLYINVAMMLWAFEFGKLKDADGKELVPDTTAFIDHGLTVQPQPFPYLLKPRRSDLEEVLVNSEEDLTRKEESVLVEGA